MFQFSGLNALGAQPVWSFGGYNAMGVKYYFSDELAIRPALLFGFGSSTEKSQITGNSDEKESNMGIGLQAGLQYNMLKSGAFVGYLGGGLNFVNISTSYEPSVPATPAAGTMTKRTTTETRIGVMGLAGFEYFIYERISLGAEYTLGLTTTSGSREVTRAGAAPAGGTTKTDDPSTFGLGFGTISFTLSAYF